MTYTGRSLDDDVDEDDAEPTTNRPTRKEVRTMNFSQSPWNWRVSARKS